MDQMPEELLYAQLAIHFLQTAAQQLHSPAAPTPNQTTTTAGQPAAPDASRRLTSTNFVLSSLMHVRRLAKTALLAQSASAAGAGVSAGRDKDASATPAADSLVELQERVAAVLDKLRAGGHLPAGSKLPQVDDIQKYKTSLQDAVHKEVVSLGAFWSRQRPHSDSSQAGLTRLTRAVRQLRSVERGLSHQARVAAAVDRLCASSAYTDDNFAYGTTPYATWHQVAKDNGFDTVHVVCQDLLRSSLADVSVLLLTNQCWDEELVDASAAKVAEELPPGAVCVEYTGALQHVLGPPHSCIVSPVSWNPGQKLYTYIKR